MDTERSKGTAAVLQHGQPNAFYGMTRPQSENDSANGLQSNGRYGTAQRDTMEMPHRNGQDVQNGIGRKRTGMKKKSNRMKENRPIVNDNHYLKNVHSKVGGKIKENKKQILRVRKNQAQLLKEALARKRLAELEQKQVKPPLRKSSFQKQDYIGILHFFRYDCKLVYRVRCLTNCINVHAKSTHGQ